MIFVRAREALLITPQTRSVRMKKNQTGVRLAEEASPPGSPSKRRSLQPNSIQQLTDILKKIHDTTHVNAMSSFSLSCIPALFKFGIHSQCNSEVVFSTERKTHAFHNYIFGQSCTLGWTLQDHFIMYLKQQLPAKVL